MGILHSCLHLILLPSNQVILKSVDFLRRNAIFCHFTACRIAEETSYFYECGLSML